MKAAVYRKYGPPSVIHIEQLEKPRLEDNEVRIKVVASSVTAADVRVRSSDFPAYFWLPARLIFGLFKPKKTILGHEFSGVVESVGKHVTRFKEGDTVFGTTTLLTTGGYAEYLCVPESWNHGVISKAPKALPLSHVAALPIGAMTALFLLKKADIQSGDSIIIYGASGSVGTYAIQIAKAFGASVTGVCSSRNIELVKSIGANLVIDYTVEDYSLSTKKYDICLDAVGKTSKSRAKKILKKDARYISVNMFTKELQQNLEQVAQMVDSGSLKPIIDKTYSLDEVVEAHEYVDMGRKKGNVLIRID